MSVFHVLGRSSQGSAPSTPASATRGSVPPWFEAVADALSGGDDVREACGVVGRDLARHGADLGEALDGLRSTYRAVAGDDPTYAATVALALGWSEETWGYVHQLSCEDPLTGVSTLAHLRARLSEMYRGHEVDGHALVVADLNPRGGGGPGDSIEEAWRTVRLVETVRTVFDGDEAICRTGDQRVLVLARRTDLGRRVAQLRELLGALAVALPVRLWIEGLPASDPAAGRLLGELARARA